MPHRAAALDQLLLRAAFPPYFAPCAPTLRPTVPFSPEWSERLRGLEDVRSMTRKLGKEHQE